MRLSFFLTIVCFLIPIGLLPGQEISSVSTSDSLLSFARRQAVLKDYSSSIQAYRQYLEGHGTDNDVRNELARTFAWSGQYDSALVQYELVLGTDSQNFDARYGICQTLAWKGNLKRAISESDSLVLHFRGNIDALLLSAKLHERDKDFVHSLIMNRQVLDEDPENVQAMIGVCDALESLERSGEAYAEIEKFRKRTRNNDEVEAMYRRLSPKALNQVFLRYQNESFDVKGRSDFRTFEAQGYRTFRNDLTVFVQFDAYRRFDQNDQSVGAGVYYVPAVQQSLYGYVLVSPDPKVTSNVDASLEYEYGFSTPSSVFLGYRLLTFKTETAHIVSPGFMWRPTPLFELRPRIFLTRAVVGKTTSYAYLVRASYEGWSSIEPYLYYSVGNEAYRAVTLDNVESSHSWSLTFGAKLEATRQIVVRANYQYLNRIGQFREMSFDIGLGFLW